MHLNDRKLCHTVKQLTVMEDIYICLVSRDGEQNNDLSLKIEICGGYSSKHVLGMQSL